MIEILFSLSLIAFILLSLLSFQIRLFNNSVTTYYQTIALIQLENFSDMLLVASSNEDQQQLFYEWNLDNQKLLPNSKGNFFVEKDHVCTISLQWLFKRLYQEKQIVNC